MAYAPSRRTTAIYARYSTDLQKERSIEDQVALCRRYAHNNRLSIENTYFDRARSGSSVLVRDGLSDMMADARAGKFDAVIVEALDDYSATKKIWRASINV